MCQGENWCRSPGSLQLARWPNKPIFVPNDLPHAQVQSLLVLAFGFLTSVQGILVPTSATAVVDTAGSAGSSLAPSEGLVSACGKWPGAPGLRQSPFFLRHRPQSLAVSAAGGVLLALQVARWPANACPLEKALPHAHVLPLPLLAACMGAHAAAGAVAMAGFIDARAAGGAVVLAASAGFDPCSLQVLR